MKSIVLALAVFTLAVGTAQAAVPAPTLNANGAQFYARCTNPPPGQGPQAVGICAAYVAGVADDLADAGQVCMAPGMTAQRLLPVALGWLKARSQNGGYPASVQIRTGLRVLYPCNRPAGHAAAHVASAEEVMANAKTFLELLNLAKPWLAGIFG